MTRSQHTAYRGAGLKGPPRRLAWTLAWRRLAVWQRWAAVTVATLGAVAGVFLSQGSSPLLVTSFPSGERLITNERAYFSPHAPGIRTSPDWIVTSGSLFSDNGAGWTGVPDDVSPNVTSSNGTDSAVFRAVTRRADFLNVTVSFQLRISELVATKRTPAIPYDGVHVFLRYQSDRYLYVVSVYRRDGVVAVKEKVPGGPINGGTYFTLAQARYRMAMQQWIPVSVTVRTLSNNAVRFTVTISGHQVLTSTDERRSVAPILAPGRVGLRGDNCEFFFRDFTVTSA
jgi:hypothetical protein